MKAACLGLVLGIALNQRRHRHRLAILAQRRAPEHSEHRDVAYHLPAARFVSRPLADADHIAANLRWIEHDLVHNAWRLMAQLNYAAHRVIVE